ncbi:MAG: universal stress protein [Halobacteriales archaeon]
MYEVILFPTDGSGPGDLALDHAVDLAEAYGARLEVVSVVDTGVGTEAGVVDIYASLEDAADRAIADAVERARSAGLDDVRGTVLQGTPHRAILEFADERDVDMIVMGTHGRTGLDRYLLGSVTEKIVRLADVPVLTVRTTEAPA